MPRILLRTGDWIDVDLNLAGLYKPTATGGGNPWHDVKTGKFSFGPPGLRILRGAPHLKDLPNDSKKQIDKVRGGTRADAITADRIGDYVRIHLFHGSNITAKFDVMAVEAQKATGKVGQPGQLEPDPAAHEINMHLQRIHDLELMRHKSGRKHLTQAEKDQQLEIRGKMDPLIRAGHVDEHSLHSSLSYAEFSRARDNRKHYNKKEWAQVEAYRESLRQKDLTAAKPIVQPLSPPSQKDVGKDLTPEMQAVVSERLQREYRQNPGFRKKIVESADKEIQFARSDTAEPSLWDDAMYQDLGAALVQMRGTMPSDFGGRAKSIVEKVIAGEGEQWTGTGSTKPIGFIDQDPRTLHLGERDLFQPQEDLV